MNETDPARRDWPRVSFGDVVKLNKTRVADPVADDIERYVGIEHIEPEDLRIRSWGSVADGTTFTNYFEPGQVLFVKRRAYQRKVAVADFSGVCSGDIYVFESKNWDVLLPELLPFLCQSESFFEHAVGTSAGSLSPRTNWTQLANYEFALPPLAEQRRVAEVLHAADATVSGYAGALNAAVALRASIRISEFDPHRSPPSTLKELCNDGRGIQIGPFGAQLHQSDYVETGVPVVMPTNMIEDEIDLESTAKISEEKANELAVHRVKPGDILLPRRGELDRRAYVEKPHEGLLCGTGSIRIRVDESVSSRAVFHALSSAHSVQWLVGNAVGTTMPNLNTTIVGRIPIALPSKSRQEIVVKQLDNLETQIARIKERHNDVVQLKAAVLASTVGG